MVHYPDSCRETNISRRRILFGGGAAALALAGTSTSWAQSAPIQVGTFAGANLEVPKVHALPPFNKQYPDVNLQVFQRTAAEQFPKMLTNRQNPPEAAGMWNDTFSALGVKAGLFGEFNPSFVPNRASLIESIQPINKVGIAFAVQPYGIAYNPKLVEKPTSWFDLFNPKYVGRVGMHYNFWDQYVALAYAMGLDEKRLADVVKEVAKHKANIGAWTTNFTQLEELIDKGEVWLGPNWGGFTTASQRRGLNIAFAWPKEGATQQTAIAHVSKSISPERSEAAQRFINYWLTPEFQLAFLDKVGSSPSQKSVNIPAELAVLEGVITPDRLKEKRLIQYDYAYVGENLNDLRRQIDEQIK